jgi:quercetin dioxygenase-like cupin family protein
MRYAVHADEGPLFDNEHFTQRVGGLAGTHGGAADEVLYVLSGTGAITVGGERHEVRPGVAVFVAAGTEWRGEGDARVLSVLVHDPEPAASTHAICDLAEVEKGTATAGRQFVLGPPCASATQFVGLIPPGRAPDHYHEYDEVIYVLEGTGRLLIGGEEAGLRPGSCIHLPRRLVHCLANEGETEMRVLGVFRPAGSPAEAYYPDGTLAAVPTNEE